MKNDYTQYINKYFSDSYINNMKIKYINSKEYII